MDRQNKGINLKFDIISLASMPVTALLPQRNLPDQTTSSH
jgi:hypothetical protein